jgi:hypothetical protein
MECAYAHRLADLAPAPASVAGLAARVEPREVSIMDTSSQAKDETCRRRSQECAHHDKPRLLGA